MALGVAAAARHRVIVIKKSSDFPSESFQDMSERLAHQPVGTHHPGQGRIMFTLVTKRLGLSAGRQHRDPPNTRVSGDRRDHIIAHGAQKGVCVRNDSCDQMKNITIFSPSLLYSLSSRYFDFGKYLLINCPRPRQNSFPRENLLTENILVVYRVPSLIQRFNFINKFHRPFFFLLFSRLSISLCP